MLTSSPGLQQSTKSSSSVTQIEAGIPPTVNLLTCSFKIKIKLHQS